MDESSVSSQPPKNEKTVNVLDLEADGLVSVYVNGKFAWQLPKKLLYDRVPAAKPRDSAIDKDAINAPTTWEIDGCSDDAFRLFNGWLYSPHRVVKNLVAGKPITPYFELFKIATRYEIHDLTAAVGKIIQAHFNSSDMSSVSETYEALEAKSPERSSLSARYAALIITNQIDVKALMALTKSDELARDLLLWIGIYCQQGKEHDGPQGIIDWMGENYQMWIDAQE